MLRGRHRGKGVRKDILSGVITEELRKYISLQNLLEEGIVEIHNFRAKASHTKNWNALTDVIVEMVLIVDAWIFRPWGMEYC